MNKEHCQHYEEGYCNLTYNGCGSCTGCISHLHLLSINELRDSVARFHPDTYRRLFSEGKIDAIKVGGIWYSTEDAVVKYIEREVM